MHPLYDGIGPTYRATRRADPAIVGSRHHALGARDAGRYLDGAVCTLAIHHFGDRDAAFAEVRRVLRGGRFVLFTGPAERMRSSPSSRTRARRGRGCLSIDIESGAIEDVRSRDDSPSGDCMCVLAHADGAAALRLAER